MSIRKLAERGWDIMHKFGLVDADLARDALAHESMINARNQAYLTALSGRPAPNLLAVHRRDHGAVIQGFTAGVFQVLAENYPYDEESGQPQVAHMSAALRFPEGRMGYDRGIQLSPPEPFFSDDPTKISIERTGHSIGMTVATINLLGVPMDLDKSPTTDPQFEAWVKGLNAIPVQDWLKGRFDLFEVVYRHGLRVIAESTQVKSKVTELGMQHPFQIEALSPYHRVVRLRQIVQSLK